jgi:hypothetical protein
VSVLVTVPAVVLRAGSRRVLAVRRNIDAPPLGAREVFASVFGAVANDGALHQLTEPAGVQPLEIGADYMVRIRRVRVEWQTVDVSLPPPLRIVVQVNGSSNVGASVLSRVVLNAVAPGSPAVDVNTAVLIAPNATVSVFGINTGVVNPQYLAAYLWGWAYPATMRDGQGYGI